MTIGERLLELRKVKGMSQEDVAEKLNVTRQTVSKWETDQSMPDFDKIVPVCELFEITADELLTGVKKESEIKEDNTNENNKKKRAKAIGIAIVLYVLAVVVVSVMGLFAPVAGSMLFLLICAVSTAQLVYTLIVYSDKKEKQVVSPLYKQLTSVVGVVMFLIYLVVSFMTMAWHITWLLFIVNGLIDEVIKLIFMMKGSYYEK